MTYCLYQCSTTDLHNTFGLQTLEEKFKKCLKNRLKSIQLYEPELITCYLLRKNVTNVVTIHYTEKAIIEWLPAERPNKKIVAMYSKQGSSISFLDELLNFCLP